MTVNHRKHIVTVVTVLLSLSFLFLSLSQCATLSGRRERMEAQLAKAHAAALEFEVPSAMILAVMRVESDFYPAAASEAGACGLMQLMPETFAYLGREVFDEALSHNAMFDPAVNIRYGTYYLSYLYEKFNCWETALAAYNAGEGRVAEWLDDPELSKNGKLTHIPFPETATYVKRVMAAYERYLDHTP